MKKIIYTVAAMLSLSLFSACSNNNHSNDNANTVEADSTAGMFQQDSVEKAQDMNDDKNIQDDLSTFITETASSGVMEVELSKIAEEKATSAEVKKFAKMMVSAHSQANSELKNLADQKKISISSSMSDEDKNALEGVAKKTGKEFDEEYIDAMVKSHKEAIEDFDKTIQDGKDADTKAWAEKMLPKLREHLDMAEKLNEKMEAKK